jgi:cellulose biosynthesis protein BcsQ
MDAAPDRRGNVVAFYSFKGGTGRSMALANVACLLAARATRPVLVIDWDLEAPGLHRYFGKELFKAFAGSEAAQRNSPGLIELFMELRKGLHQFSPEAPASEEAATTVLDQVAVSDFVIQTDRPNLHLIKAGAFDEAYAGSVSGFDWQDFYARAPSILRMFSERLAEDYEWVLIDSRTGLTDTSGICTMLMPETLVVVFTPNRQSVEGGVDLARQAAKHRSGSDDLRPLAIYPLPSRVEASEPALRKLWRHGDKRADVTGFQTAFEQVFKEVYQLETCDLTAYFDDVQIQHVPRYAYGEDIAVLGEESQDRFSLTRSFERFIERLVPGALPWDRQGENRDELSPLEVDRSSATSRAVMALQHEIGRIVPALQKESRRLSRFSTALRLIMIVAATTYAGLTLLGDFPASLGIAAAMLSLVAMATNEVARFPQRLSTLRELQRDLEGLRIEMETEAPNAAEVASWRTQLSRVLARSDVSTSFALNAHQPAKVFISYRRSDSGGYAGRLYDTLGQLIGPTRVFMDIDSILPGDDFVASLSRRIAEADVVVAVIGPDWVRAGDGDGRRPDDAPSDFVQTELRLAFERGRRIIPVLIDGAEMPAVGELPGALQRLANLNALQVRARTWSADVMRLASSIDSPTSRNQIEGRL